MPGHPSPHNIPLPQTDLLSYLFPPGTVASTTPLYIDAANPESYITPLDVLSYAKRIGYALKHTLSLPKDSVVLLLSQNHILVPVLYLSVTGNGFIFSGSNPAYEPHEIAHQIRDTAASIMLVDPNLVDGALAAAEEAGFDKRNMYLFDDKPCQSAHGIKDWRSWLSDAEASEVKKYSWTAFTAEQSIRQTSILNYSSGTTGLSKGVRISSANVIANVEQSLYMRRLRSSSPSSLVPAPRIWDFKSSLRQKHRRTEESEERWLGFLPLYHAYGQLWSIVAAARTLTPVFFMRTFDFATWLSNVEKYRVTHVQTAPPVLVLLAKRPEVSKHDLRSLKNLLCGAAPLSKELQAEVKKVLPGCNVSQTMGMTELTCSTTHVPGLVEDDSGSVGQADPNCEIKLVDEGGRTVEKDDEPGELCVKGPNVCLGYWRNEEATRNTFDEEGFLKSGDVAVRRNGWYTIVDRKKELIKVRGFQVAPAELEGRLMESEWVADAAVVGVKGEHEEFPRAYVVLKDGATADGEKVRKWLDSRVARHKRLTGGVTIVTEIPKSPSGKIIRKVMRQWAERDGLTEEKPFKARL